VTSISEAELNFINGLFEPYKEDLLDESKDITCDDIGKDTGQVSLLTHQKIVKDYINLYTPYRGLLLYHGLGSGKTCSSIAIAEGMKRARKIIIMTPASLKRNYIEEIKKCGDLIYRKNQFWEWISTDDNPELLDSLSAALGLPRDYIIRNHGAWLVNVTKTSNYSELTSSDKKVLNDQLDEMIKNKYTFINYNGLRRDKFGSLTNNFENNIFDNSVVIIDEAHNLISRIVNKINKISKFSEKKRFKLEVLSISNLFLLFIIRSQIFEQFKIMDSIKLTLAC
jgi:thymidine kinase